MASIKLHRLHLVPGSAAPKGEGHRKGSREDFAQGLKDKPGQMPPARTPLPRFLSTVYISYNPGLGLSWELGSRRVPITLEGTGHMQVPPLPVWASLH